MANNFKSKNLIQVSVAIVGIVALMCMAIITFKPDYFPVLSRPTPTVIQPTSGPLSGYQPEFVPILTDMFEPTKTATFVPTNVPAPTLTPIILPTLSSLYSQPSPDLIVTSISDPVCATEYDDGTILRFSIFVRNIGRARTRSFGPFNTDVFLILGQRHYSLDEWATQFNGLVGSSVTEVFNLNPDNDIKFTVVIDLKGNKSFGIEVIANSGDKPIREADMTNNTLTKYFSVYCY